MSHLDDYPLIELDRVEGGPIDDAKPGDFVRYSNEPATTFGMLIARVDRGSFHGDVVMVLWSQAPVARLSSSRVNRWEDL